MFLIVVFFCQVGSGVPSPNQPKIEPHSEGESSLKNDLSTESEPGFASQESVEDENVPVSCIWLLNTSRIMSNLILILKLQIQSITNLHLP